MDDILDLSHIPPANHTSGDVLKRLTEARRKERDKCAQIARKEALELERVARQLRKMPEVAERLYEKAIVAKLIAAKINSGREA